MVSNCGRARGGDIYTFDDGEDGEKEENELEVRIEELERLGYREPEFTRICRKHYFDKRLLGLEPWCPENIGHRGTEASLAAEYQRHAATEGDVRAGWELGFLAAFGIGVKQDSAEALAWYRLAADQGDADRQFELGQRLEFGRGVDRDLVEAFRWYRLAAGKGDADRQWALGDRYASGDGVKKDCVEAFRWFRLAAGQGDADRQWALGDRYASGDGVKKDCVEAFRWFRLAAEQGDADRQWALGDRYASGDGVTQDLAEAERWFVMAAQADRVAAEAGSNQTLRNILESYLSGRFGTADDATIFMWSILYTPWWEWADRLTWRKDDERMETVIERLRADPYEAKRLASEWKSIHWNTRRGFRLGSRVPVLR